MMKPIYNRFLPIKGFKAMNLFGLILVRKGLKITSTDLNHEKIHSRQLLETLILPFYLIYLVEWLVKLIYYQNWHIAYRNISFEREAYYYQCDLYYLKKRKWFEWTKLIYLK